MNTFSFFFMDCCREKILDFTEQRSDSHKKFLKKYFGISIMKCACNKYDVTPGFDKYVNSPKT